MANIELRSRYNKMMREVACAGGIIFDEQWRVLLVIRDDNGMLSFPKGHVDPGEKPEDAAVREVGEETQVQAKIIEYLGAVTRNAVERDTGEEVIKKVDLFVMRQIGNLAVEPDSQFDWFTLGEWRGNMFHAEDEEFLLGVYWERLNTATSEAA